jgi:hypothetical protein
VTDHYRVWIQGPPLAAGVVEGDVVLVPVFTSDEAGGSPFWMRITSTRPVDGGHQDVTGVRIVTHLNASRSPEADRVIELRLPLDRVARRVFVPADSQRPARPAIGRAQVGGALPQRISSPDSAG